MESSGVQWSPYGIRGGQTRPPINADSPSNKRARMHDDDVYEQDVEYVTKWNKITEMLGM